MFYNNLADGKRIESNDVTVLVEQHPFIIGKIKGSDYLFLFEYENMDYYAILGADQSVFTTLYDSLLVLFAILNKQEPIL